MAGKKWIGVVVALLVVGAAGYVVSRQFLAPSDGAEVESVTWREKWPISVPVWSTP